VSARAAVAGVNRSTGGEARYTCHGTLGQLHRLQVTELARLRGRHECGAEPVSHEFGDRGETGRNLVPRGGLASGTTEGVVHEPAQPELGRPYDIHSYADVSAILADNGFRVIVPYLRGFGSTRCLSKDTVRNGQRALPVLLRHRSL
jgi:hypothetical protein